MQAILLAGGLGTRLRSVVSDRPKPMALVEGRPFMEYVVHELVKQGVTEIIFAVGYKGSMVEEYFQDGKGFGVKISYSYEEELLGTAGAIKNAGHLIHDKQFLVLNADTFYLFDYNRLSKFVQEENMDMALVLRRVEDVSRYGEASVSGNRLTGFNEKSSVARSGTINGGIYMMKQELLDEIPDGRVSLENEMIPKWMQEGRMMGAVINDGYFIDIGIPEDYFRFQEDVKKGIVVW